MAETGYTPETVEENGSLHVPLSEKNMFGHEVLVPVSLNMSIEGYEIHDAFTWNLRERHITPEIFARTLVEDLVLPEKAIAPIAKSIRTQIERHSMDLLGKPNYNASYIEESFPPVPPENPPETKECLCLIQINITLNDLSVRDQFEWDLNATEELNSPEAFARSFCLDVGLPREFQVAISHSIREQLTAHRKAIKTGQFKARPLVDKALRSQYDIPNWTPTIGPASKFAPQRPRYATPPVQNTPSPFPF